MEIPQAIEELNDFKSLVPTLVLASGSPNRRELLENANIKVIVKPQDIKEDNPTGDPGLAVKSIANKKMEHYINSCDFNPNLIAVCVDTLVYFNGCFLGKPANEDEALKELESFSGKKQEVYSGFAIYYPQLVQKIIRGYDKSIVFFNDLTKQECINYVKTGEWKGAAGGYRIQKTGHFLISKIEGSWTNVIGMPLEAITRAIKETQGIFEKTSQAK